MNLRLAGAGLCAVLAGTAVVAQQTGTPGAAAPGAGGQTGAGQVGGQQPGTTGKPGTAGQGARGQAGAGQVGGQQPGTTGKPGTAGQTPGGQTGAGQVGGQQNVPGKNNPNKGFAAGMPGGSLGITQMPWFSDPGVRKQLNLNQTQLQQLDKNYGQAYGQFQSGYGQLGKLTEQQRLQRLQDLSGGFYNGFGQTAREALNRDQQQRFQELYLQYRGPAALTDPTVQQQLKLTEEQRLKLSQGGYYGLSDAVSGTAQDPSAASQRFNTLRQQQQQWMSNFLTPEQMTQWRQITGTPYNFQFNSSTGTSGSTTNPGATTNPGSSSNPGGTPQP